MRSAIIGLQLPAFVSAALPDAVAVSEADLVGGQLSASPDWFDLVVFDLRAGAEGAARTGASGLELLESMRVDDIIWIEDSSDGVTMSLDPGPAHWKRGGVGTGLPCRRPESVTQLTAQHFGREVASIAGKAVALIVDSEPDVRNFIASLLRHDGLRTIEAADGHAGLALARSEVPAVITTGVVMTGRDGWQLLTKLKADPATSDIPTIVCTPMVHDDALRRGSELGCVDYISMPFSGNDLVQRVLAWVPGRSGNALAD